MTVTHGELEAMAIENSRVFPSCKMVIFYSYSNVYERVKDWQSYINLYLVSIDIENIHDNLVSIECTDHRTFLVVLVKQE